jgi:CrcB protein
MRDLSLIVGIGLFGALGAVARYVVRDWAISASSGADAFPTGTLLVNVVGCFLLGLISFSAAGEALPTDLRRALAVGFLGALTTYSTFGAETYLLLERGRLSVACGNVLAQLVLGVAAVWLGASLGRAIWGAVSR